MATKEPKDWIVVISFAWDDDYYCYGPYTAAAAGKWHSRFNDTCDNHNFTVHTMKLGKLSWETLARFAPVEDA